MCYTDAVQHPECWFIINNPYTEHYSYSCDKPNKKVSCGSDNNACEMFICECDRKAAECLGVSPWNPEYEHLPSDRSVAAAHWISPQAIVQTALSNSTVSASSWELAACQLWLLLETR
ncbi:hypothetical protein F7725_015402 [Dissostichus mawsoni]|uniref:Phospholipase A2-like central domain-containing protein n=1 Tax=Dissostichus mawsoni TaxID=36200 RepID=A0A7J5YHH1_DISMA|nr:hypothetical protein F7725_015402 [Dissostichus mawsoni]